MNKTLIFALAFGCFFSIEIAFGTKDYTGLMNEMLTGTSYVKKGTKFVEIIVEEMALGRALEDNDLKKTLVTVMVDVIKRGLSSNASEKKNMLVDVLLNDIYAGRSENYIMNIYGQLMSMPIFQTAIDNSCRMYLYDQNNVNRQQACRTWENGLRDRIIRMATGN